MKSIIFIAICLGILKVSFDVLIDSSGFAIGPVLLMGGPALTVLIWVIKGEVAEYKHHAEMARYEKEAKSESA